MSRKYYGRSTLRGKQKWGNLAISVVSVTKQRPADEAAKREKLRCDAPQFGSPDNPSRSR